MRTLDKINAEIVAHEVALTALRKETAVFLRTRNKDIVKAFDDGATRAQLCEAYAVSYQVVANVLMKARRTERSRLRLGMDDQQTRHFDKLLDRGIRPRVARQIAVTT